MIEPVTEQKEEVKFVLDVRQLASRLAPYMPKADKKGKTVLSPEIVVQTRRRVIEAQVKENELRSEYPQLVIDIPLSRVSLNDAGTAAGLCKNSGRMPQEYSYMRWSRILLCGQRFQGHVQGLIQTGSLTDYQILLSLLIAFCTAEDPAGLFVVGKHSFVT